MRIVKKDLKVIMIYGRLQSTYKWANKVINKNKTNKTANAKILINKFFELTNFKKNKVFYIRIMDGNIHRILNH